MHPRTALVTFLLIYSVDAYVHDQRFVSNENMTYLEILRKVPTVDDLIIPSIDMNERGSNNALAWESLGYIKISL